MLYKSFKSLHLSRHLRQNRKNARSFLKPQSVSTDNRRPLSRVHEIAIILLETEFPPFYSTLKSVPHSQKPLTHDTALHAVERARGRSTRWRQGRQGGGLWLAALSPLLSFPITVQLPFFLTHFNFPLEQKRIPSGKILQLSQEVQYKRHEPVLGLKESREQSNSLVPTLSLFQSLGRVAWKPALGHFVLHFTVMNSFVIYILSVRPTFKKPIAQVSQVWNW